MHIAKQGLSFIAIGCCLIGADWIVFVALTAAGAGPVLANVAGRVVGALLGFWANGWITFAAPGSPRFGARRFGKYLTAWVFMTLISTALVTVLAERLSLEVAWLAKPIVEVALAMVAFFVSRHWVYR